MKLRIRANTLRFRLTQGECAALADGGICEEQTILAPGQVFTYKIVAVAGKGIIRCVFEAGALAVFVGDESIKEWAEGAQVGMEATLPNGAEPGLFVIVEKDFKCLTPRAEDEDRDTFPNPLEGHSC
jgi:hypothetical protein